MKRILILFAHPKFEKSRTNKVLVRGIKNIEGVTFHDLYERYPDYYIDVAYEKKLLEQHDIIIWHHPFYWYSCPPLLKQWIDVVLEFGWAYGPDGRALQGKKCLQVITTGGSEKVYCAEGRNVYSINEFLRPFEQTARLCRMEYLAPFAVMGTHQLTEDDMQEYASQYRQIIDSLIQGQPLQRLESCVFQNDIPELNNLNSIVLTESTAIQVFGIDNPIGQNMRYVRRGIAIDFVVTGVIYDPPSNTQIQPKYVAHLQAVQGIYGEGDRGWVDKNPAPGYVFSFVKLNGPEGVPAVASALNSFWEEAIPERAEFMTPLVAKFTDIHFNPPIKWELSTTIDMSYIYGLVVIGAFILIIAMTNFVNLITSQAGKRQKEIGLRKTLGSTRGQLRLQFFTESAGMVLVAMVLAMLLMLMGLPRFNDLIDKNISVATLLEQTALVTGAIGFAIFILLIAGLFPAFYFTRKVRNNFNLNQLLKPQRGNTTGKNILVIVQFAVAITLIIGTLTVFRQLQLINSGKLGENREAILGIRTTRMGNVQQVQRYRNEIEKFSNVASSTLGMHLPRQSDFGRINTKYIAPDKGETAYFWNKFDADGNFTRTFDLELLAGRDFRENVEPNALILNEAAIKELDLSPEEALGLRLEEDSLNYSFGHSDGIVIGVVADFAYKSVKEKIEPLVICANTEVNGALSVRMLTGDKQETIAALGELWGEIYPGRPFEYWFLDEGFERLYNQERRLGKLIPLFSGLAILIALLGLFALTAFISELRRKEIGIRKVLGCSTQGILKMLSWQFFKTILIAVLIGIPLAWYGMEAWLTNFTYRVEVDIAVIGLAVAFVLLLSFLTMSIKSLKAANANPVDSLKYE